MNGNLIVISSDMMIKNEAEIINELFNNGMELFHLRKSKSSELDIKALLEKVNPNYYEKICLHNCFNLSEIFNLKRLHQKSYLRSLNEIKTYNNNFIWSTSFHSIEEINLNKIKYNYAFLSPIFNSISKKNYTSNFKDDFKLNNTKLKFPIVALGGICLKNLNKIAEMNFKNIAVLGAIWNSNNIIKSFIEIKTEWAKYIH